MHINTTRCYLAKNHYYAFRPRKKPYLRPYYKTLRLRWAQIYRDLQLSDQALVRFPDKLTFKLGINTSPPWTRYKIGEAYKSKNLKPTFKLGRSSVGIQGEILLKFKGGFVILKKGVRINSYRYINEILIPYMAPFYAKRTLKYGNAIFIQDGAGYYTSKTTLRHLKDLKIQVLPLPAQSPDLNPIKHLQRIIKLRISKRRHLINNL